MKRKSLTPNGKNIEIALELLELSLILKKSVHNQERKNNIYNRSLYKKASSGIPVGTSLAAIVKYASDLGILSPAMMWNKISKHKQRKVTPEQLKKDLETILTPHFRKGGKGDLINQCPHHFETVNNNWQKNMHRHKI